MRSATRQRLGVAFLALFLSLPASLTAQIHGIVTDARGTPLSGISVELLASDTRLVTVLTDAEGRFRFAENPSARATSIRAGGLSYRSREIPVVPGQRQYHVELDEEPISLPSLIVETERDFCSDREDQDEARALWDGARSRYSSALDTLGIATYLASDTRVVPPDSVGFRHLSDEPSGQRGSSSLLRFSWTRRAQRSGYAFPTWRVIEDRSFRSWVYAPLEADFAPHFADPVFGRLHELFLVESDGAGWVVGFCPRDDDRPSIHGTMALRPDTTIATVEWIFHTPEPVENAGGRVAFPPVTGPPSETYLLPDEGLVWRQVRPGEFWEKYQRFEEWKVAAGDSVPFLPVLGRGGDPPGPRR